MNHYWFGKIITYPFKCWFMLQIEQVRAYVINSMFMLWPPELSRVVRMFSEAAYSGNRIMYHLPGTLYRYYYVMLTSHIYVRNIVIKLIIKRSSPFNNQFYYGYWVQSSGNWSPVGSLEVRLLYCEAIRCGVCSFQCALPAWELRLNPAVPAHILKASLCPAVGRMKTEMTLGVATVLHELVCSTVLWRTNL